MSDLPEVMECNEYLERLHGYTEGTYIGPFPVEKFLTDLMPWHKRQPLKDQTNVDLSKLGNVKSTEELSHSMIRYLGPFCPSLKFSFRRDRIVARHSPVLAKPIISCFNKHTRRIVDPSDEWSALEMMVYGSFVDFWPYIAGGRYNHYDSPVPYWALVHANAMFTYQFRTFFFSLEIYQKSDTARLLRWDRSGVIVTEAFSYIDHPDYLVHFLQRFDQLTPAERGWDPTVQPATYAEAQLLNDAVIDYLKKVVSQEVPYLSMMCPTLDMWSPAWKVRLEDGSEDEPGEVIVRKPFEITPCYNGSGKLCRFGYHVGLGKLVFMKDNWAFPPEDSKYKIPEVEVYKRIINEDSIRFTTKALYAEYVPGGPDGAKIFTRNQDFATKDLAWVKHGCARRVYTRLVQDINYPLRFVRGSKELVQVIHDVLIALQDASKTVFHTDIDAANIRLTLEGKAILNDWDYAARSSIPPTGTRRINLKSGDAVVFQPVSKLTFPARPHRIQDDMEAAMWTMFHVGDSLFEPLVNRVWGASDSACQFAAAERNNPLGWKLQWLLKHETVPAPEYYSEPYNDLISDIRKLFGKYYAPYSAAIAAGAKEEPALEGLKDTTELLALFEKALSRRDWPIADADHRMEPTSDSWLASWDAFTSTQYLCGLTHVDVSWCLNQHFYLRLPRTAEEIEQGRTLLPLSGDIDFGCEPLRKAARVQRKKDLEENRRMLQRREEEEEALYAAEEAQAKQAQATELEGKRSTVASAEEVEKPPLEVTTGAKGGSSTGVDIPAALQQNEAREAGSIVGEEAKVQATKGVRGGRKRKVEAQDEVAAEPTASASEAGPSTPRTRPQARRTRKRTRKA